MLVFGNNEEVLCKSVTWYTDLLLLFGLKRVFEIQTALEYLTIFNTMLICSILKLLF